MAVITRTMTKDHMNLFCFFVIKNPTVCWILIKHVIEFFFAYVTFLFPCETFSWDLHHCRNHIFLVSVNWTVCEWLIRRPIFAYFCCVRFFWIGYLAWGCFPHRQQIVLLSPIKLQDFVAFLKQFYVTVTLILSNIFMWFELIGSSKWV